jgi:hypothetical protein
MREKRNYNRVLEAKSEERSFLEDLSVDERIHWVR